MILIENYKKSLDAIYEYTEFKEMILIENYKKSLDAIYDHVGFKEDWVVCPIDDSTEYYWYLDPNIKFVRFAETIKKLISKEIDEFTDINDIDEDSGAYYQDSIYTQRFYNKWVYNGSDFTMIFCDPHSDGMTWFRLFDNSKRIMSLEQTRLRIERKNKLNRIK